MERRRGARSGPSQHRLLLASWPIHTFEHVFEGGHNPLNVVSPRSCVRAPNLQSPCRDNAAPACASHLRDRGRQVSWPHLVAPFQCSYTAVLRPPRPLSWRRPSRSAPRPAYSLPDRPRPRPRRAARRWGRASSTTSRPSSGSTPCSPTPWGRTSRTWSATLPPHTHRVTHHPTVTHDRPPRTPRWARLPAVPAREAPACRRVPLRSTRPRSCGPSGIAVDAPASSCSEPFPPSSSRACPYCCSSQFMMAHQKQKVLIKQSFDLTHKRTKSVHPTPHPPPLAPLAPTRPTRPTDPPAHCPTREPVPRARPPPCVPCVPCVVPAALPRGAQAPVRPLRQEPQRGHHDGRVHAGPRLAGLPPPGVRVQGPRWQGGGEAGQGRGRGGAGAGRGEVRRRRGEAEARRGGGEGEPWRVGPSSGWLCEACVPCSPIAAAAPARVIPPRYTHPGASSRPAPPHACPLAPSHHPHSSGRLRPALPRRCRQALFAKMRSRRAE